MKKNIKEFKSCIKGDKRANYIPLNKDKGMEGVIVYTDTTSTKPNWLTFLETFCDETIPIENNNSNKAVMLVRISNRIMALIFGYGKALIKEECIEKNFGLITALNMLDEQKIKAVNAATIEDMIVNMEKQCSRATDQEDYQLNHLNDVMTSVTGKSKNDDWALTVSGKDSLIVTVEMYPTDLREKLQQYLTEYNSKKYLESFPWIENIREERDKQKVKRLDIGLSNRLKNKDYEGIYITPPDIVDWDKIKGFLITGEGKRKADLTNYSFEIEFEEYFDLLGNTEKDLGDKLKRDKLVALDNEDGMENICNIYTALIAQVILDEEVYILYSGQWYKIKQSFYEEVMSFISNIPICEIELKECEIGESEGSYNERICQNPNLCLMDKKMVGVKGGNKKIEACDIFTRDKKFIHVKKRENSNQLSHLFAQGKVSIECFIGDMEYREQVYNMAKDKFMDEIFDYSKEPEIGEFEVVYGIIAKKKFMSLKNLPFFSLVNLMMTFQEFQRMHIKASVKMILQKER